jgi:hypothetical protein
VPEHADRDDVARGDQHALENGNSARDRLARNIDGALGRRRPSAYEQRALGDLPRAVTDLGTRHGRKRRRSLR